jgi:hypothetical protein
MWPGLKSQSPRTPFIRRYLTANCDGYTFLMEPPIHVDLTTVSFDEFVLFLFDREIPADSQKQEPWYWHVEVEFDAAKICTYYVQLFRQPEFLLTRFTKPQLEEGFWGIQGPNLSCSVQRLIEDSNLPLSRREECIRSMFDLYRRLFATEPLETSVQMWWDSLCYDWHCGNRKRERGGEDLQLQEVFFHTLVMVLSIDSEICQDAALHGLGHLHHPQTAELIERYLREHPALAKKRKEYALAAARFRVQ